MKVIAPNGFGAERNKGYLHPMDFDKSPYNEAEFDEEFPIFPVETTNISKNVVPVDTSVVKLNTTFKKQNKNENYDIKNILSECKFPSNFLSKDYLENCLPIIRSNDAQCIVCGSITSTKQMDLCCKHCEFLLSNSFCQQMRDQDIELLYQLMKEPESQVKQRNKRKLSSGSKRKTKKMRSDKINCQPSARKGEGGTTECGCDQPDPELAPSTRRRRRHDEWTKREIVILLQCTKLLIDCELKCVSQALYHFTNRKPGKCLGRAAEKKLKRLKIFENWRKSDKKEVLKRINGMLKQHQAEDIPKEIFDYCINLKENCR